MNNERIDLTQFGGSAKGPWRYEMPPEEGMRIMAGEFTMVAELSHLMTNMSPETDDANPTGLDPDAVDARLILASPDLLAELKRCYEKIDTLTTALETIAGDLVYASSGDAIAKIAEYADEMSGLI